MKATGIVRRIDDLGRIVIPKEIRRQIFNGNNGEDEPMEFFMEKDSIVLKRYISGEGLTMPSFKTYEDGLNDAWELAKRFAYGDLSEPNKRKDVFGDTGLFACMCKGAKEALSKVEMYEKEKAINIGDVVIPCNYSHNPREVLILDITPNGGYRGIWLDTFKPTDAFSRVTKTGRTIDIVNILKTIEKE